MKQIYSILVFLFLSLFISINVMAVPIAPEYNQYAPSWVNGQNTVHAEWDQWNNSAPTEPPALFNPDNIQTNPSKLIAGCITTYSTYNIWTNNNNDLITFNSSFDIHIGNFENEKNYKRGRFQIYYFSQTGPIKITPSVWAPNEVNHSLKEVKSTSLGSGRYISVWDFTINPNPKYEVVTVDFDTDATGTKRLNVDDFIIDTQCTPVPEPATMLLFGTGLAGLVGNRIRRKKK